MRHLTWILLELFAFGFMLSAGMLFSYLAIDAATHGWELRMANTILAFNDLHEGVIEATLFPLATIISAVVLVRRLIQLRNKYYAKETK
jgi:ABC-type transporter Mla maintaining outer membrane lipid asymmetry permease subunit MlaE